MALRRLLRLPLGSGARTLVLARRRSTAAAEHSAGGGAAETSATVRRRFVEYFAARGHTHVPSAGLVPLGDSSLLFTNAGMVQFKDYFLGAPAPYDAAVSVQRCMRAGGKHNDLDNVGYTPRHHTLFEMLGNFSFGAYFKERAIVYGWDFLTRELRLPADRLRVTILEGDEEAFDIWHRTVGLSPDRIVPRGLDDNFWSMGDGEGPCGPCTEIFWDRTPGDDRLGEDRWLEIWNLVFMQNFRRADGSLGKLARQCVDTGMGLERVVSVLQGQESNYGIDTFRTLIAAVDGQLGARGLPVAPSAADAASRTEFEAARRIIADHMRACTYLIADGVLPGNVGRGYVLRRILRRAMNAGRILGIQDAFLHDLVPAVVSAAGAADQLFLSAKAPTVQRVLAKEQAVFLATLDRGLAYLTSVMPPAGGIVPGEVAFRLYDTYGFPLDLTAIVARRAGCAVAMADAELLLEAQRKRSRATWSGTTLGGAASASAASPLPMEVFQGWAATLEGVRFTGERLPGPGMTAPVATIRAVHTAGPERAFVVLDESPFYGRGGGQVGDTGRLETDDGALWQVVDTTRPVASLTVLHVRANDPSTPALAIGQWLRCHVDGARRTALEVHHTATHLLHAALRKVLGTDGLAQAGSLVEPERLRFDFTHPSPLTADQLAPVEAEMRRVVALDLAVVAQTEARDAALGRGATALFSDKYGATVRTVEVPGVSLELCGGTHVERTGQLFPILLVRESAVAAGVRRIEAVAGRAAVDILLQRDAQLHAVAAALKADTVDDVVGRVGKLVDARAVAVRQLDEMLDVWAQAPVNATDVRRAPGPAAVPYMVHRLPEGAPTDLLRRRGTVVRTRLPHVVHVLVRGADVACAVGAEAPVPAPTLLAALLAHLPGGGRGGGGQRDWAQGRLPAPSALQQQAADAGGLDVRIVRAVEHALASTASVHHHH